jgi:putative addiction module component (TIGR02574 family)
MSSLMVTLGIDRLSATERLQLAQEIFESLDAEGDRPDITDAQRAELDRRLDALETNPKPTSTWEEVEARVLARLRQ